jgi:hypothetical protein
VGWLIECLISFSASASAEDFQLQQQQQGDFRQVGHYGRFPVSFSYCTQSTKMFEKNFRLITVKWGNETEKLS